MNPVRDKQMFYVYVLQSQNDKRWYTGSTNDLQKRFSEHNNGKVYSTKGRGLFKLIYYEACLNELDARVRGIYLKTGMASAILKIG